VSKCIEPGDYSAAWRVPYAATQWDQWRHLFSERGYATLAPGWPDDPATVAEAKANPDVFADKTIGLVTDRQPA
jgi:hypothetical protein